MNDHILWCGSEGAYMAYVDAVARVHTAEASGRKPPETSLLEVNGNVGIISVAGTLVSGTTGPWGPIFGVTGYEDITNALVAAIQNPEVGAIVLNTNSPGGHTIGVNDVSKLVRRVDKIKPVVTYTGGRMHSAAMWIGSAGRHIIASDTSEYGNIGIIQIHAERSAQLEKEGIKVTVIRAGENKGGGNPYEKLSEKAQASMQQKLDTLYGLFLGTVAEHRGLSSAVADKQFGQAVDFIGAAGVSAGLIDAVGTFDDAYAHAAKLAEKTLKKAAPATKPAPNVVNYAKAFATATLSSADMIDNPLIAKGTSMVQPLSSEQLAAMAAGVDLTPEITAPEATKPNAPVIAPATQTETKPVEAAAPAPDAMAVLQGMLATAQAANTQHAVTVSQLQAQVATLEAAKTAAETKLVPFVEIARGSLRTMGVALGRSASAVDGLNADQVLAEHASTTTTFKASFKVGGVASTGGKKEEPKKHSTAEIEFLSRLGK